MVVVAVVLVVAGVLVLLVLPHWKVGITWPRLGPQEALGQGTYQQVKARLNIYTAHDTAPLELSCSNSSGLIPRRTEWVCTAPVWERQAFIRNFHSFEMMQE